MTSSDTTGQGSPSTTPPTSRPQVTTPPLRVTTPQFLKGRQTPSTTTPIIDPDGGPAPVSDPLDDAPTGGSTPSSGKPARGATKLDRRALADIMREAVYVASGFVHEYLARTDEAREQELWIATDEDREQIGDPLAAIGARHGIPTDGGADMADLIAAGFGAVAYLTRNVGKAWRIRRGRRQLADVDPINERPEQ